MLTRERMNHYKTAFIRPILDQMEMELCAGSISI